MKFQYKMPKPKIMEEHLKQEKRKKAAKNKIDEKFCPTCKATYNDKTSKGICFKCFGIIPSGKRYEKRK